MNSTLFDILGALIGLVTVLLLLSLIVTALVQATQAMLRLRGRNLLFGLTSVLTQETGMPYPEAKQNARDLLNANEAPLLRGRGQFMPTERVGKWFGPQVSWLDDGDLKAILATCRINVGDKTKDNILARFDKVQGAMRKRFLRTMRLWTIAWALPVAFYFQVNTLTVLNDFLTDPELRARAVAMAPDLQAQAQATLGRQVSYESVSAQALERLTQTYPKHRAALEEVSGVGQSKGDIVSELSLVLKDDAERRALVEAYERLLDEHYRAVLNTALEEAGVATQRLGQFNIEPWRDDWGFYVREGQVRWNNWIGVFMTMILLSFGAPFWFNALSNLMNLRDALKPQKIAQPATTRKNQSPESKTPSTSDNEKNILEQ
jgi:hypothetical protein